MLWRKNAKAPDGGFRLMIAMRSDNTALYDWRTHTHSRGLQ